MPFLGFDKEVDFSGVWGRDIGAGAGQYREEGVTPREQLE